MDEIREDGEATGATFWKLNEPFTLLRDGHVTFHSPPDNSPGKL